MKFNQFLMIRKNSETNLKNFSNFLDNDNKRNKSLKIRKICYSIVIKMRAICHSIVKIFYFVSRILLRNLPRFLV